MKLNKWILFLGLILALARGTAAATVVKVNGAGATFPYPIYSKWFADYEKAYRHARFNYRPIGSGGGVRQLLKGTVDFGASDVAVAPREMKKAAWPIRHIPTVLGAVAIAYHLPRGAQKKAAHAPFRLDGETLAAIFLGTIRQWNHSAIAGLNPDFQLPAEDILVVRRAEGSGTTAVFADYLSKASGAWEKRVGRGKTLRWPVGIGARGNDGVTNMVKQTPGSLGYVELAYAINNQLPTAALKNRAGEYIGPTLAGMVAAAGSAGQNFTQSITHSAEKGAYPISAFTFILLPQMARESAQIGELKKFLHWALDGPAQASARELHYAPLPAKLAQRMRAQLL